MDNFWGKLDTKIIDYIFQPIVDLSSKYIGLDKFFLADIFLGFSLCANVFANIEDRSLVPLQIVALIINSLAIKMSCMTAKRHDSAKQGFLPWARRSQLTSRIGYLLFSITILVLFIQKFPLDSIAYTLFSASLWIVACVDGPPMEENRKHQRNNFFNLSAQN